MPLNNSLVSLLEKAKKSKDLATAMKILDQMIDEDTPETTKELQHLIESFYLSLADKKERKSGMNVTTLQLAAKYGSAKSLAFLLKNSKTPFRDIHTQNKYEVDAFTLAATSQFESKEKLEVMLTYGLIIDNFLVSNEEVQLQRTFIHVIYQNPALVPFFLANGASVGAHPNLDDHPLYHAAVANNEDVIDILLKNGANINQDIDMGVSPLILAASKNNIKAMDLLIKKGAKLAGPVEFFLNYFEQKWPKKVFQFGKLLISLGSLGFHQAEGFQNIPQLYNYFHTNDEKLNQRRLQAFIEFPCLFGLISFNPEVCLNPSSIAKAIDTSFELASELQKHFNLQHPKAHQVLKRLPAPYSSTVSTQMLVNLFNSNVLTLDSIPWYTQTKLEGKREIEFAVSSSDNKFVKQQQKNFYIVLETCHTLAKHLTQKFQDASMQKNLFASLVNGCLYHTKKSNKAFWQSLVDELPVKLQKLSVESKWMDCFDRPVSAIEDYAKSIMLPILIRAVLNSSLSKEEKETFNITQFIGILTPLVAMHLFNYISIEKVFKFSANWDFQGTKAMREAHKGVPDRVMKWEPLIPVEKIPAIPETIPQTQGWKVIPLQNSAELKEEASPSRIDNCIAIFAQGCFTGNYYFFSIRNQDNQSRSEFCFILDMEENSWRLHEHKGYRNKDFGNDDPEYQILKWFINLLRSNTIQIDYDYLKQKSLERQAAARSMYEVALYQLNFDPTDEKKCKEIYHDYYQTLTERRTEESFLHKNFDKLTTAVLQSLGNFLNKLLVIEKDKIPLFNILLGFCHQATTPSQVFQFNPMFQQTSNDNNASQVTVSTQIEDNALTNSNKNSN